MGLTLCGSAGWAWLSSKLSTSGGTGGVSRVQKVKVAGKVKCPCGCKHEFDAEFEVEQKVAGSVTDFDVKPIGGTITNLCAWKMQD